MQQRGQKQGAQVKWQCSTADDGASISPVGGMEQVFKEGFDKEVTISLSPHGYIKARQGRRQG